MISKIGLNANLNQITGNYSKENKISFGKNPPETDKERNSAVVKASPEAIKAKFNPVDLEKKAKENAKLILITAQEVLQMCEDECTNDEISEQILAKSPNSQKEHKFLTDVANEVSSDKPELAIELYEKAFSMAPEKAICDRADLKATIARTYLNNENPEKAIANYIDAFSIMETNPRMFLPFYTAPLVKDFAIALENAGNQENAREAYKTVINLNIKGYGKDFCSTKKLQNSILDLKWSYHHKNQEDEDYSKDMKQYFDIAGLHAKTIRCDITKQEIIDLLSPEFEEYTIESLLSKFKASP